MRAYKEFYSVIKRGMLLLLIFLCAGAIGLWADTIEETSGGTQYEIDKIEYEIKGYTRKSVLIHYLQIEKGETFESREELEAYIADKLQLIENQRTLAEGSINPTFHEKADEPGKVYVDLNVTVSDTWNYLVLPYFRYDSNEGLLLSLRGRNYNFLGGMEKLEVNFDYLKSGVDEHEYSLNGEFAVPFYWWGYEWMFDFEEDVVINPEEPTYFYSRAGLSLDIPTSFLTWQAGVDQEYYLNEDGEDDPDTWYLTTAGRFGTSIPLGFELPGFTEVHYSPAAISSVSYKPGAGISEERAGVELGGVHGISTGRIDWKGNFRSGAELSVSQDARWNFEKEQWYSDFEAELQVHETLGFMGISSRLTGFYKYQGEKNDAGDEIRGILDRRIDGNGAIFGNFDFPFKMWIWFLDRWFEGHLSPFFDFAMVHPADSGGEWERPWYGTGLEAFAYFKKARSIYLRMSVGVDAEAMLDGVSLGQNAPRDGEPIYEVYIGLGHHY